MTVQVKSIVIVDGTKNLHTFKRSGERWELDTPPSAQQDRKAGHTRREGNVETRPDDPYRVSNALEAARGRFAQQSAEMMRQFSRDATELLRTKRLNELVYEEMSRVDPNQTVARRQGVDHVSSWNVGRTHHMRQTWRLSDKLPAIPHGLLTQVFDGMSGLVEKGVDLPAGLAVRDDTLKVDVTVLRVYITKR
ncbi:MAG: hypothetical protein WBA05_09225 [Gordonia sp. (in: high G+C Gram-positive bacteria)]|uniref:hypothetical protein n=1 Tax=Gordonia sp. (in: high G+C Gram-positive bacteria) TaxID=84139 RepID=UPI003C78A025